MICDRIDRKNKYIVKRSSHELVVRALVAILLHGVRNVVNDSPSELVQAVFTHLDDRVNR